MLSGVSAQLSEVLLEQVENQLQNHAKAWDVALEKLRSENAFNFLQANVEGRVGSLEGRMSSLEEECQKFDQDSVQAKLDWRMVCLEDKCEKMNQDVQRIEIQCEKFPQDLHHFDREIKT